MNRGATSAAEATLPGPEATPVSSPWPRIHEDPDSCFPSGKSGSTRLQFSIRNELWFFTRRSCKCL